MFSHDWLVVVIDMMNKCEHIIINDPDKLKNLYAENKNNIWIGFNSRHYDQYIFKAIMCDFNLKEVNDYIITQGKPGYTFSRLFNKIPLINYDIMQNTDRGLKCFEGCMGNDIRETSVPFDIDRKLSDAELQETVKYCRHDVEQTIEVFLQRKEDFDAQMGLIKMFDMPLSSMSKTKVQISADILGASRHSWDDEFDIDFPDTLRIEKYTNVLDWYRNPENHKYTDSKYETLIAGVPHVFAWGGVHGAIEKYHGTGSYINMDVGSLYPSLMCEYNLMSRSVPKKGFERFKEILRYRLELKHNGKKKEQAPLKIVLNGTYGAMKDKNNNLYDPLQANKVCVYGQLLLLDLIEKLEPHCQIIQSNTDGVLIKLNHYDDYDLIDDICFEWEQRTRLSLEFEEYREVYQKDVNNYIIIDSEGKYKSKGAYVKKLGNLDYDLPIVNTAMIEYILHGTPVETTIGLCDELKEFQLVSKVSGKYAGTVKNATFRKEKSKKIWNGDGEHLKERVFRIFASLRESDGGIFKVSKRTGNPEKIPNSPERCFIFNADVNSEKVPDHLDKQWYINITKERLKDFGVV